MNVKIIGGIILAIMIVVIIVLIVYRKSFFSKKTSESTDDNEKESSSGVEEVEAPTVTEEEAVTEDEYDETNFEEENMTGGGGTNYEVDEQEQENVEEEYYDEADYFDISNYCAGETDGKNIFINAVSTKFSTTENNSDECRNLCSQTADCELYLNEDENTCYLYKDVDDISMYCESGPGHEYYGNAKIKDGLHPAYEINSQTSSEVIDNMLEKEGWEISTDISISDKSGQWRNLFHYGNGDGTRVPAMWIIANQHWKLHFRIKTTTNWNDGLNFFVPEEFQNPGETFNVRIRYKGYDTYSKIIVYVNDVFVKQERISLFTPVKNQQFDLKKSWGDKYTDKENYTISNFTLKEIIRTWEDEALIIDVTEQQCADEGGTNYNQCPETGIIYCCGVCDGKATCPSDGSLQNCACIGELTKENSDVIGYALKYNDLYRAFEFDEEKLWNHWVNNGKNENRIMNPRLPMDDLYNQEGFPAHPMPTHPGWGKLKNDDGNVIFEDGWIWHLPMPSRTEVPNGTENWMVSVPIDNCRFYRDYNNELGMDHPVKLYVNVDDYAYIIHNNHYITKINGFQGNPGVDLTLTPGKNRIMIVAVNTGGPAGLQVAMMDDVNDAPLISSAVQSSWRYINDMYYTAGMNYNLASHGNWEGCAMLKVPNNDVDVDGKHTFHYCYNNTSGVVINGQIASRCDDFVVIWHERKLLLAKGMHDPEPCFVKIRPGKNLFAFCVSNYGGPGWIAAKCTNRDNNSLLWKTETNNGWYYKKSGWYPGPAESYKVYEHTNFNGGYKKEFRYGVWDLSRMQAKGVANDSISSAKVPKGMQVVNFQDTDFPNGWNQTLFAGKNYGEFMHFNDRITAFVVQTPAYNRALFFDHTYARNQLRFTNSYVTNNSGLTTGTYNKSAMENKKVNNDQVDDIIYPKGMKVTIYEHDNKTGDKRIFGPSGDIQKQEGVGISNKNTSIVVETSSSWGYTDYQIFNGYLLGAGNVEKFLSQ